MKAIKYLTLGLAGVMGLASCSDSFIDDIKNYDNVNGDIYNYESGINGRLNDLYSWSLPDVNITNDGYQRWKSPSEGNNDIIGTSTEEYSGFSDFLDPTKELSSNSSSNSVIDLFMGDKGNVQASVYGRIRNINDFITNVQSHSASDEVKQKALGQAYFFRAWCYYLLMKWYGGVPLVTEVLEPEPSNFTPRSSARETKDFILSDLDQSARLLAPYTMNGGWSGSDFGRITTGTALALKGRVLLLWASPLFNRANDQSRWTEAYNTMRAEKDSIDACGYHLFQTTSNVNGSDFALQFLQSGVNPEAVFVTLYNNVVGDDLDNQKNSMWERWIRPANTTGSGKNASAMLVDLFPMSDGKIPAGTGTYTKLQVSDSTYDANVPFLHRDPRFYRTFTLPGFRWAYNGDASEANSLYPSDGQNYVLWNYCWYTDAAGSTDPEASNNYFADGLLNSGKSGVYVRKKSDDYDVNSSPLYNWQATATNGGFTYSGAQCIELRYAEVLLNLAEAACGAGQMSEAVGYLQQIRARAGYTAANNYGLPANLASDQATCMSAILYERQIEFAYEGKRMDDMRRWMLYDGGATQPEGAPADWTLTGWGGNTCTWLGVKPLNGQRRENMVFRVADSFGTGGTTADTDPMINETRPDGVDLRLTGDALNAQMDTLAAWYRTHLVRQLKKGDAYNQNHIAEYINFRPKYYFLGFTLSASSANTGLPQTCGWIDYNTGSLGTFDPLAD